MSRKFVIDLDDKTYSELREGYQKIQSISNDFDMSFEEFLADLLKSYADVKNQMNFMGDTFKNMMNDLSSGSMQDILSKLAKMGNFNFFNTSVENSKSSENKDDTSNDSNSESKEYSTTKYKS